jgi:hypothetical protein
MDPVVGFGYVTKYDQRQVKYDLYFNGDNTLYFYARGLMYDCKIDDYTINEIRRKTKIYLTMTAQDYDHLAVYGYIPSPYLEYT